jgi:CBS domain-containing protein
MTHPATLAKEIMTRDILTANVQSTVEEMVKLFIHHRVTGVPVIDAAGKMIGVCSEYDLIRQVSRSKLSGFKPFRKPIRYSTKVEAVDEDTPLELVVQKFVAKKFRRLPVVDHEGHLVGIITRRDLMKVFFYQAKLK